MANITTKATAAGYFTSGQTAAAKRWAKKQLKQIIPAIRIAQETMHTWYNQHYVSRDEEFYNKLMSYAERYTAIIGGWLAINEDDEMFEAWTLSSDYIS